MSTGFMIRGDRVDLRGKTGIVPSQTHVSINHKRNIALAQRPADMLAGFVLHHAAQDDGPSGPLHNQALQQITSDTFGMDRQGIVTRHANRMNRPRENEIDVPRIVHLLGELMLGRRLHDQSNRIREERLLRLDRPVHNAAPALAMDHPLPLEILQREPHRRSRDIELRGKPHLRRQAGTACQTAIRNPFLNVPDGSRAWTIVDYSKGVRLFQGHDCEQSSNRQQPGAPHGRRVILCHIFGG